MRGPGHFRGHLLTWHGCLTPVARAIVMPSMGMYTEEGVLTAWLRSAGSRVSVGEPVAEITTEKATFEIPAPEEGTLHPVAAVGTTLRVEVLMGYILRDGEPVPSATTESATRESRVPASVPSISNQDVGARTPLRATPVAKRMAAQHGIDLKQVTGSGPGGRIVEADIQALIAARQSPAPESAVEKSTERVPITGLRSSLAQRLRRTLSTAASTTLTREATADTLVSARRTLAEKLNRPLSYDALFIKIFAAALRERPELNAMIEGDSILRLANINVGFAVAVPNGLVVPVIQSADSATLRDVTEAVSSLTQRVLAGRLHPADLENGTATVSNLGNYGIDAFTPILNGSQSVILGIGRIVQRPVVRNNEVTVGHTCVLSLTFDHRVADGAPAAQLLDAVVRRMNDERFLAALTED
jgi:pyruvate dehydrogenase E2 component (dihydrolipoamide acetyltransferase)